MSSLGSFTWIYMFRVDQSWSLQLTCLHCLPCLGTCLPCSLEPGADPSHRSWPAPGPAGRSQPPDPAAPLRAARGTFSQRLQVSLKPRRWRESCWHYRLLPWASTASSAAGERLTSRTREASVAQSMLGRGGNVCFVLAPKRFSAFVDITI